MGCTLNSSIELAAADFDGGTESFSVTLRNKSIGSKIVSIHIFTVIALH